jgi:hypothetical protein
MEDKVAGVFGEKAEKFFIPVRDIPGITVAAVIRFPIAGMSNSQYAGFAVYHIITAFSQRKV